jgi:hypothetical protein
MENTKLVEENKDPKSTEDNDVVRVLSDAKVDVDIEPDVKSNDVKIQLCSCSIVLYCFSNREK